MLLWDDGDDDDAVVTLYVVAMTKNATTRKAWPRRTTNTSIAIVTLLLVHKLKPINTMKLSFASTTAFIHFFFTSEGGNKRERLVFPRAEWTRSSWRQSTYVSRHPLSRSSASHSCRSRPPPNNSN